MKTLLVIVTLLVYRSHLVADTVILSDKQKLHGELIGTQAGFVILKLPDNEGDARRRIKPEMIDALTFSDTGEALEDRALIRSSFIDLIDDTDAKVLVEYLEYLESNNEHLSALSYAKLWHPKNQYTSLDSQYRRILIEASISLDLPQEALVHAQSWLKVAPTPYEQVLPWQIVAQHHLDREDAEAALWVALAPLAHGTQYDSQDKAPLHRIAADAYLKLGLPEQSKTHTASLAIDHAPVPPDFSTLPSLMEKHLTFSQLLKTSPE